MARQNKPSKMPETSSLDASIGDYRHACKYFLRQWRGLVFLVLLCFLASGLAVLQPWPLKLLVDALSAQVTPPPWFGALGLSGSDAKRDVGLLIVIAAVGSFLVYGF